MFHKKIFFSLFIAILFATHLKAQYNLNISVKDSINKKDLAGAVARFKKLTAIADSTGTIILKNIPAGKQTIVFSFAGYENIEKQFDFPLMDSLHPQTIFMAAEEEELDEVIVQSTRTSRTIGNTPTRVETIDGEELDEKNNMRPANVAMLLHESTGLQVQQTSATSGSASIRVQGLDGRYTQLLKDGYPNFGNFAGGLSILEIPPLDLKQVEIIKGPASTLYGGGAIAGVVNFISKTPKEKGEYNLLFNQSNIGQTNIGAYASQKKDRWGYSMLATVNLQKAYDVDKDDFSDLPRSNNFTLHPRLFYYAGSTVIMLGNSFTKGSNKGGDMHIVSGNSENNHDYFEDNATVRNTSTLEIDTKLKQGQSFKLKQSLSFFNRKIRIPSYVFEGLNTNSYTDVSYLFTVKNHTIITGANAIFDKFKQKQNITADLAFKSFTTGLYIQDTWDITDHVKMESGVRFDHVTYSNINLNKGQFFALPRISLLFKISDKISSRIGGGLGYKVPTVFTEQTESLQYKDLLALNNVEAERSIGGTADVNYKTMLAEELQFSINQMFFYTSINKPLVLEQGVGGFNVLRFVNASKPVQTKGFETNVKFIYKDAFKLFAGYTYTDAKANYLTGNQFLPLLPKNKLNLALVYEKESNFKIGLEAYLTDRQFLYNGTQTPSYWELGLMAEKTIKKVAFFINFENLTDQRQSRYKRVVNPPLNAPTFDDIWNHLEGFVMNGGVKVKL